MILIGELKNWLSAFADDEEVAIDDGGLTLETRTEGLVVGGWPEASEELICIAEILWRKAHRQLRQTTPRPARSETILSAENMHTAERQPR